MNAVDQASRVPAAPSGGEFAPLAAMLDDACGQALAAGETGIQISTLHVSQSVYESISAAKGPEVGRGQELVLLGLRVVVDEQLSDSEAAVN